ncbi:MAG: LPS assembly lipoprotein LptE [Phycisphaerales bacterium]|nr:hypothetical protein [Planctomycetota bacterium]MCH8509458.1 LPS assembly lipoprotein LptE [Phycisphaerales bacterium]
MIRPRTLIGAALLGASLAMPGCSTDPTRGYAFAEPYDASVRTVGVPIFANRTFARGTELTLTDAIIKQIQQQTPWRVVSPDRADTVIEGAITNAELGVLSNSPSTGLTEEQTYRITVRFAWRDNRTGETRVARENFAATGTFVPVRSVGERIEVGQREAIEELARDIVASLRSAW